MIRIFTAGEAMPDSCIFGANRTHSLCLREGIDIKTTMDTCSVNSLSFIGYTDFFINMMALINQFVADNWENQRIFQKAVDVKKRSLFSSGNSTEHRAKFPWMETCAYGQLKERRIEGRRCSPPWFKKQQ